MIKTFADKETKKLAETGKSNKFPSTLIKRAATRLVWIDAAITIDDLKVPLSNRLEKLSGNRNGQYSIRINQQWRVCFRFEKENAFDVEITDYH